MLGARRCHRVAAGAVALAGGSFARPNMPSPARASEIRSINSGLLSQYIVAK
jgi:hypothetical protein